MRGVRAASQSTAACRCRCRVESVEQRHWPLPEPRARFSFGFVVNGSPARTRACLLSPADERHLHGCEPATARDHEHRHSARPHDASRSPLGRVERGGYGMGFGGRGFGFFASPWRLASFSPRGRRWPRAAGSDEGRAEARTLVSIPLTRSALIRLGCAEPPSPARGEGSAPFAAGAEARRGTFSNPSRMFPTWGTLDANLGQARDWWERAG